MLMMMESTANANKFIAGRGSRIIIIDAGSRDGFIGGACHVMRSKNTKDYHEEMDGEHYEKWFKEQLLPECHSGDVVVMDNASYHSVLTEDSKIPSRKEALKQWLISKGSVKFLKESRYLVN